MFIRTLHYNKSEGCEGKQFILRCHVQPEAQGNVIQRPCDEAEPIELVFIFCRVQMNLNFSLRSVSLR